MADSAPRRSRTNWWIVAGCAALVVTLILVALQAQFGRNGAIQFLGSVTALGALVLIPAGIWGWFADRRR